MKTFEIIRIRNDKYENIKDYVTEEITLTIEINNTEFCSLLCSNQNLKEFVIGYLFTSGIINSIKDVNNIEIFMLINEKWHAHVELTNKISIKYLKFKEIKTTGCSSSIQLIKETTDKQKNKVTHLKTKIKASLILLLMKEFQSKSEIFNLTGGVHSSAIVHKNKIITFMEDIGRHNAIDKVIGCMLNNHNISEFADKILLTSGRISSEILHKIIICEIPIVISRSAPTDRAIEICRKKNITLVGFARANKMNIYSGSHRIILEKLHKKIILSI